MTVVDQPRHTFDEASQIVDRGEIARISRLTFASKYFRIKHL